MSTLSLFGFTFLRQQKYKQLISTLYQQEEEYRQVLSFLDAVESSQYRMIPSIEVDENSALIRRLMSFQKTMSKLIEDGELVRWHDAGMAKFNELLTQNYDDQIVLYNKIISELCRYVNANQAALFLIEKDQSEAVIKLEACYAYDRKKFLQKTFQIGETLVGQSILERNTIFITNVPQYYTHITSGLGEATPGCILITPLYNESSVVGAIELASFKKMATHEIQFVESLSRSITASIFKMKQTQELKLLFSKSQVAESAIRQKEEEILQQMEELEATNDEMSRKSAELEKLTAELADKNNLIESMREQEKILLESKLQSQRESYELIIERLKFRLEQYQSKTITN